jgi:hypothetical protein
VAVNVMPVNLGVQIRDEGRRIFGAFAAAKKQRRADEANRLCVRGKIIFNLVFQSWQGLGERVFQHDQRLARAGVRERVAQHEVVRRKNIFGEENAQLPADLNGTLDDGHDFSGWNFFAANQPARSLFTQ